ncbi:MAG TPA: ribosome small subunit-dependent GTPase A, partial [Armatimonadota bacterium]
MRFQEKNRLKVQLATLPGDEQQQLKKRAELARNEILRETRRAPSLAEMMLRLLDSAREEPEITTVREDARYTGLVVGLSRRHATVQCADMELTAPLAPALAKKAKSAIALGDRVLLDGDPLQVVTVLPRRTRLSRPDPSSPHIERVLAANIDVVGLVTSLVQPQMRPRLLERALLAIEHGGALPIIVATKVDLLTPEERERELGRLHTYQALGIRVIPCSSATGEGLPTLRAALAGRTCVLVGHSGVGKSSLLNGLDATLALRTGALHRGSGLGRHTTTASCLYYLDGDIRLIDTPGVRDFGQWKMTAEEVRSYFSEFLALADGCAFGNCSHTHEPRCAVKDAVDAGEVSAKRYAHYQRLLRDEESEDEFSLYWGGAVSTGGIADAAISSQ